MVQAMTSPIPSVFEEQCPPHYVGTLVYFHPGGLQATVVESLRSRFFDWRILRVELMLCAPYVESANANGQLVNGITDIGRYYLSELEERCSSDSELLFVGWSFGGVIAYDVACGWKGKTAPRLVFVDSIAPISSQSFSDRNIASRQTIKWFIQYLECLKKCRLSNPTPMLGSISGDEILSQLLGQCKKIGAFDERTKLVAFKKVFSTFAQGLIRNANLTAKYEPGFYKGELLLLRANQGLLFRFKYIRHMGWRNLVSNLHVRTVSANHYQIVSRSSALNNMAAHIVEFAQHPTPKTEFYQQEGVTP